MRAGFKSLGTVQASIASEYASHPGAVSKAMLSLYERGEIGSPRPQTLALLAKLYKIPYEEMVTRWCAARFGIPSLAPRADETIVSRAGANECVLGAIPEDAIEGISIVTVHRLQEMQSKLPNDSAVGVVSIRFLDDNVLFNMVADNLERGIRYSYLLPEDEYTTYQALLERLREERPQLRRKLDGVLTAFVPRASLGFPMNCVLHLESAGTLQGFVGIMQGDRPRFYQVADNKLTIRLYEGFRWAMTTERDPQILSRVAALKHEQAKRRSPNAPKAIQSWM